MMTTDDFVAELFAQMTANPDGFAEALLKRMEGPELEEFRRLFSRAIVYAEMDVIRAMGSADALVEIADKTQRIAGGYAALGETFAADAFAKFTKHLLALAQKRAEPVEQRALEYARERLERSTRAN